MQFGVIGGDRRQAELLRLLRADGHTAAAYGIGGESDWEGAVSAPAVILPLPLCTEGDTLNIDGEHRGAGALFRHLRRDQILLAGQVKPAQMTLARELGLNLIDYFRREELTVANAAATAEGAIAVLMQESDRMLLGSRCLVLGYGRIGKQLSSRLAALGAQVSAAARRPEDWAWICACGFRAVDIGALETAGADYDFVVNTVPAPVAGEAWLRQLPPGCICVDLASVRGIDHKAGERLGIPVIWARGLPGKLVPRSAAGDHPQHPLFYYKGAARKRMREERIGFAVCGSYCTHEKALAALEKLTKEYRTVIPIASENAAFTDTRFGTSDALLEKLETLTGQEVLYDIPSVEPIGQKGLLDVLVVAPATGNTLAKLANGITDTAVTMAVKSHLRNGRPVVLALSTNDGLSGSAQNIGALLARKHYYFVPFGQDDPEKKPTSLAADFEKLSETVDAALRGEQLQPLLR